MSRPKKAVKASQIVLIDDDPIVLEILNAYLSESGYENTTSIASSVDAVRYIQSEQPDLILVDLEMPDVSGKYLLQVAKDAHTCNNTPVVFITANSSEDAKQELLDQGAADVLTKPVHPGDLVFRVEHALRKKIAREDKLDQARHMRNAPASEKYLLLRQIVGRN